MNIYEILKRPITTEKSGILLDYYDQYIFEVDRRANKLQIKEAVEKIFDVDVISVNTMNKALESTAKATKMDTSPRVLGAGICRSSRMMICFSLALTERADLYANRRILRGIFWR